MRRVLLICAVIALASFQYPARADPVVKGIAAAAFGIVVLAEVLGQAPAREDHDFVAFQAGRFDVLQNASAAGEFGVEYRFGKYLLWKLKPFVGTGGTTKSSFYGYGGIRLDTYWSPRIVVAPSFAVAGYSQGHGKDLGSPPALGRSGLDFEYNLSDDVRLGMAIHHMSNGKVLGQNKNPGTELVAITLAIAIK
jgi:hypothetical protein